MEIGYLYFEPILIYPGDYSLACITCDCPKLSHLSEVGGKCLTYCVWNIHVYNPLFGLSFSNSALDP